MANEKPHRIMGMRIKGVLGLDELSLEFGQLTVLRGGNGSGKSSVLEAMKAGVGGGDLAKLKKVGTEDDPEVVMMLDGGDLLVERKGSETILKQRVGDTAAYEKVRKPQTFLDRLFDQQLSNPLRFLNAHPNVRTDILLEALPLDLNRDALMSAIGDAWPAEKKLPEGHALMVLDAARTVLYDERTGINHSKLNKERSANELLLALPAEMPEDPAGELATAATARDELFQRIAARKAEANVAEQQARDAAQAAFATVDAELQGGYKTTKAKLETEEARAIGEIQTELERAIAELRAAADQNIAAVKERTRAAIQAERARAQNALDAAGAAQDAAVAAAEQATAQVAAGLAEAQAELNTLEQRVTSLTALSNQLVGFRKTKQMADQFGAEAASLRAVSERLTKALDDLEVFKAQLLNGLPIEGLEVRGKDIYVHGVPFDQLNTAQRIHIAVKVATLRARDKQLPIMFVDGAEALDSATRAVLFEELERAGVQAIVAMVDDSAGPLMVQRDGGPAREPERAAAAPTQPAASSPRRGSRGRAAVIED